MVTLVRRLRFFRKMQDAVVLDEFQSCAGIQAAPAGSLVVVGGVQIGGCVFQYVLDIFNCQAHLFAGGGQQGGDAGRMWRGGGSASMPAEVHCLANRVQSQAVGGVIAEAAIYCFFPLRHEARAELCQLDVQPCGIGIDIAAEVIITQAILLVVQAFLIIQLGESIAVSDAGT